MRAPRNTIANAQANVTAPSGVHSTSSGALNLPAAQISTNGSRAAIPRRLEMRLPHTARHSPRCCASVITALRNVFQNALARSPVPVVSAPAGTTPLTAFSRSRPSTCDSYGVRSASRSPAGARNRHTVLPSGRVSSSTSLRAARSMSVASMASADTSKVPVSRLAIAGGSGPSSWVSGAAWGSAGRCAR